MKTLKEQIAELRTMGYRALPAQAKVAHDAVLLAMHRSGFKPKSAIKGGVVMSSITGDIRRATMDMDIDFVHHSISLRSIERFVRGLNRAMPELAIGIDGKIIDLKHEDYRGKRVYVSINDGSLKHPLRTKIDIGVHTHEEMAQVEYAFDVVTAPVKAELQANSNEQIFVEKLASLLRHGALSNRPKDFFDMYYLSSRVRLGVLRCYVPILVYDSKRCPIANKREMIVSLSRTFGSARYMRKLASTRINWLGISPHVATAAIMKIVESL